MRYTHKEVRLCVGEAGIKPEDQEESCGPGEL